MVFAATPIVGAALTALCLCLNGLKRPNREGEQGLLTIKYTQSNGTGTEEASCCTTL